MELSEVMNLVTSKEFKEANSAKRTVMIRESNSAFYKEKLESENSAVIDYFLKEMCINEFTALYFGSPVRLLLYVEQHLKSRNFLQDVIKYYTLYDLDIDTRESICDKIIKIEEQLWDGKKEAYEKRLGLEFYEGIMAEIYALKKTLRHEA